MVKSRGDHFRFGSVRFLSKKVTKPNFFFLKKKPKPVQTGLARFFFWFCFVSVWFGFFGFLLIKPKPNLPVFSKF